MGTHIGIQGGAEKAHVFRIGDSFFHRKAGPAGVNPTRKLGHIIIHKGVLIPGLELVNTSF